MFLLFSKQGLYAVYECLHVLSAWLEDCSQDSKKDSEEGIYSPSVYLSVKNSYIFFGLANTNGTVPQPLLNDPALQFAPVAITSIILAKFADGPHGPGDLVMAFKLIACSLHKLYSMPVSENSQCKKRNFDHKDGIQPWFVSFLLTVFTEVCVDSCCA